MPTPQLSGCASQPRCGTTGHRGARGLGLKLTHAAMASAAHLPATVYHSRALASATQLHTSMDQNEQALILPLQHVALARQLGDRTALAGAMAQAGFAACSTQREEESREHLLAALDEARAIGDLHIQCIAL